MNFQYKRIKHLDQVEGQMVRARPQDAGADIKSAQDVIIRGKESEVISTGISINVPEGYVAMVRPRSGLAAKFDIVAFGGTVDPYFCGELRVKLFNFSKEPYKVCKGDRIAQIVIVPCMIGTFEEVEELDTEREIRERNEEVLRGENGFGSSGK